MKTHQYTDSSDLVMAQILRRILYAVPLIIILLSLVLFYVDAAGKALVILGAIPFFLILLYLLKIGYLRTTLNLFLAFTIMLVTWSCINGNGIHDIGIVIYPISVLVAAIMFTKRNLLYFSAFVACCLSFVVLGDLLDIYKPQPIFVGRWPDVIMIGFLLLIGLIITSSHSNRLKEAIIQRIEEGKRQIELGIQIEQNLEERQQLFREVHHRVKNHLAFINSLIDMESMANEDVDSGQTRELQSKIVAIARVHDQLYQSDNFDLVRTKNYFDGIISQFAMNYQLADAPIDLKIDDFEMEVNRIIYLGISVHEIICWLSLYQKEIQKLTFLLTNEDDARQLTVIIEHEKGVKLSDQGEKLEFLLYLTQKLEGKLELIKGEEKTLYEIEF